MDGDDAEPNLRLRRAGFAAGAAFLLLVTALLLPWWVVSNRVGGSDTPLASVYPFGANPGIAHRERQLASGALVGLSVVLLFVRVASRGWAHEPKPWRRDLAISAGLVLAALAVAATWPGNAVEDRLPFWGGRTFLLDNATGMQLTVVGNPGLGWWLAALAAVVLAAAWWAGKPDKA